MEIQPGDIDRTAPDAAGASRQRPAGPADRTLVRPEDIDQPQAGSSALGALYHSFLHGMGNIIHTGAQIGARMGEAPQIGQTEPEFTPDRTAQIDRAVGERERAYQASPGVRAHPYLSKFGEIAGAAAPTMALPGGALMRGATLPARIATGAGLGGLTAAATTPVQPRQPSRAVGGVTAPAMPSPGGPTTREAAPPAGAATRIGDQDFWTQKGAQLGFGMVAGGAVPLAGRLLSPAMPTVTQFASNVGRAFPALRNFMFGTEERTVDGFDRSIARQVLEPIAGDVPRNMKAGHGLVDHVYTQLDRAYDDIKPSLHLSRGSGPGAWQSYEPELQRIQGELSDEGWKRTFDNFVRNRVTNRFDRNGVMDGEAFKSAEHDLTKKINQLYGTQNEELGEALSEVRRLFRDSLMKQNPAQAPQLAKINDAYSMFYRMSRAAGGRTAEGKFTPSDMLGAIRRGERSPHAFARGKAMAGGPALPDGDSTLQGYATLGNKLLKGARIGPLDIAHAFHPGGGMGSAVGRAAIRGLAYPAGRAITGSTRMTAPIIGRAAGQRGGDWVRAQQKVSQIQRDLYSAKRRGDVRAAQKLQTQMQDADAEYRRLRPRYA